MTVRELIDFIFHADNDAEVFVIVDDGADRIAEKVCSVSIQLGDIYEEEKNQKVIISPAVEY